VRAKTFFAKKADTIEEHAGPRRRQATRSRCRCISDRRYVRIEGPGGARSAAASSSRACHSGGISLPGPGVRVGGTFPADASHGGQLLHLLRRGIRQPDGKGTDGVGYGFDHPVFRIDRFHPHSVKQHTAFAAKTRSEVDAFHAAALKAGGTENGTPGLRQPNYGAAFVLDCGKRWANGPGHDTARLPSAIFRLHDKIEPGHRF
jgi:hypothetical protein